MLPLSSKPPKRDTVDSTSPPLVDSEHMSPLPSESLGKDSSSSVAKVSSLKLKKKKKGIPVKCSSFFKFVINLNPKNYL